MSPQAIASIRWSTDGKYHVARIDVQCGDESLTWLTHCRKFPMLCRLRLLGASEGTANHVQRQMGDTRVRVEYWSGGWIPANSDS